MTEKKFHTLKLADVQAETESAICITFTIPDKLTETFRFTQGQFLTLRCNINGEQIDRSYSICSGINEDQLRVAIKRVRNGSFSNYANDHFKSGMPINVMPPQGNFHTQLNANTQKKYMCIAAGSGITPILSIIKSILHIETKSHVTLIYGNRQSHSIMFKEDLGFIKNRFLDRFSWINILNAEDQGYDLGNGIIDNKKGTALHKSGLIDILATDDVFICGPEAMMSEVSRGFRASGIDDSHIHYELFANSFEDTHRILEKSQQRIATYGEEKSSTVTVKYDGRSIRFQLSVVGENILDAGMHNGLDLPYACKAGVCSTCKARLLKGKVDMNLTHALEQHEIDAGYILTCQAHPVSDEVVVDFDQR